MRVAVIGGGVIGLASAWALSRAGVHVEIFEKGRLSRGATWAAGGMLAAHIEEEGANPAFLALAQSAQSQWPRYALDLRAATGVDVGLRGTGTLLALFDQKDLGSWRQVVAGSGRGDHLKIIDAQALRDRLPGVSQDGVAGVWSRRDGVVDPRSLGDALCKAVRDAGVVVHEDTPVLAVEAASGRVSGIVTPKGQQPFDQVVLAAGAWSGRIGGLPFEVPVRPVKGQMACVHWDNGPLPAHVIWGPGVYIIPRHNAGQRDDQRLLIGATVEEAGFDPRLTAGGMATILQAASRVLPAIADCGLMEMWAGFRPCTPDHLPLLGTLARAGGPEGLTIATGHHRNGILLAPVSGDVVADLVLGRTPRLDLSAFDPLRFTPRAATALSGLMSQSLSGQPLFGHRPGRLAPPFLMK